MRSQRNLTPVDTLTDLVGSRSGVLLDLNETFAFGCDRFDSGQDFASTYRRLGGRDLEPVVVNELVISACGQLFEIGRDTKRNESFPEVVDVLSGLNEGRALPSAEIERLADVLGTHEVGTVSPPYAVAVKKLARRFRLGLVSNIWASSTFFVDCLRNAGVEDCFESVVFSSDHGITKPSAAIFRIALAHMELEPHQVVYVGNSLRRDVAGARNAGIPVVWINAHDQECVGDECPDFVVADFRDFVAEVA